MTIVRAPRGMATPLALECGHAVCRALWTFKERARPPRRAIRDRRRRSAVDSRTNIPAGTVHGGDGAHCTLLRPSTVTVAPRGTNDQHPVAMVAADGSKRQLHPGRLHGLRHLTQFASPAVHAAGDARHCPMSEWALCRVTRHRYASGHHAHDRVTHAGYLPGLTLRSCPSKGKP